MAITITPYDFFKANAMGGVASGGAPIDFLTDTINVPLVTNVYVPNLATHDFWDDVSANELATGNGYTTNGVTLGTKTVTVTAGNADYDAADVSWTFTATKTFRYAVVMKWTGTASTSPLMLLIDFGVDRTEDSQFDLRWNASGIFRLD
jgi:hypothetical protein